MSEYRIKHDPRTKQQIKDCLYNFIYEPVHRRFEKELGQLIHENCRLLASSHRSFIYRGELYVVNKEEKVPRVKNRLHRSLHPRMKDYLSRLNKINQEEIPYVLGFINQVLNASDDMQDYFLVLPEPLHQPLQRLVDTCPCQNTRLTPESAEEMRERNKVPIDMIKRRLVTNLVTT